MTHQETVWTPNGDAMISPITPITPPEFEPATSQQPTLGDLAEMANRILQADVPGVS